MKSPILGSSYVARSVNAADNRMVNLFPEVVPEAGKEPAFLQRAPGLNLLANVGTGPIRGLWAFSSSSTVSFVVSGTELYKMDTSFLATKVGDVSGTGPVSLADNGTQLFVACNGPSFIYNNTTNAFAQITDPDFPGAVTVAYLDGYFVFNEPNSQKLWVTSLLNGLSVDPLDFASTEGSPDGLVAVAANFREVWAFGTNSIEVWYDAATTGFPLARIPGAFNELGCVAPYSVAKMDNSIFWLGCDRRGQGIVYRANGYTGERVSTHAVEWQIQQYGILSDAVAYTYQQDGHNFYVLIFPAANTTWVYDAATQEWHERAGYVDGEFVRHQSNCQMSFDNLTVVGDYQNGNIYNFSLDTYADNNDVQKWLRSWRALPTGSNTLRRTAQHSLQLDCQSGVGGDLYSGVLLLETGFKLLTESGDNIALDAPITDAFVSLRWSDDGGHTFSGYHLATMGQVGQYGKRVIWRRLGMTMKLRDRVYELSGTDPVKIAIMGAELILSPTNA